MPAVKTDKAVWEAVFGDEDSERLETLMKAMPPAVWAIDLPAMRMPPRRIWFKAS